jgi:hypothetical protein
MKNYLFDYVNLIESFINRAISAESFESLYIEIYPRSSDFFTQQEGDILANLFYSVDAYCFDPELRDSESDIDEEQLLADAKKALHALRNLE